ncbi:MAG: YbhN family protein [Pirellula sp.]|jgi:hypothetical protein|nr:flippase-like domain-containing protein [Pirellula sp.]
MPSTNATRAFTATRAIAFLKITALFGIVVWLIVTFPRKDAEFLYSQKKNWLLLSLSMSFVLIAHLVSYWRWQMLVQALNVPMRLLEAIRLGFLGTLLNQVSFGSVGGDLFKAIEAARRSSTRRTEVVASVLVDRAIGLLGLLLVASIGLSLSNELSPRLLTIKWAAISLVGIALLFILAIVFGGRFVSFVWLRRIPWVGHTVYRLAQACMIFQGRPRLVAEVLGTSMCVHFCMTVSCYLISASIYDSHPTLLEHFMTIPPAMAAATLPLTPGGIGVQEAAISKLFLELPKIPEGYSALIMAALFRLFLMVVPFIGAVYYFSGIGKSKSAK